MLQSFSLFEDIILSKTLPLIKTSCFFQWLKLTTTALWYQLPTPQVSISQSDFHRTKNQYLENNLEVQLQKWHFKLLSCCRLSSSVNSIIWLLTTCMECKRCIYWWLGWLLDDSLRSCSRNIHNSTKYHVFQCLNTHQKPSVSGDILGSSSYLPNKLPRKTPQKCLS